MNIRESFCASSSSVIKKVMYLTISGCLLNMIGGVSEGVDGIFVFTQPRQAMAQKAPAEAQPLGEGYKLLEKQCLSCHVIEKIVRYRKSRDQWEQTITNMINNNGVVLTEAEKAAIVDYLVSTKKTAKSDT